MSESSAPQLNGVPDALEERSLGPSPLGRRAFIAGAAGAAIGVVAAGATAHAIEPGAGFFEVQSPRRLADTRAGTGYQVLGNNTIRVRIGGNGSIPSDAVAAVFTLTCVNNVTPGTDPFFNDVTTVSRQKWLWKGEI